MKLNKIKFVFATGKHVTHFRCDTLIISMAGSSFPRSPRNAKHRPERESTKYELCVKCSAQKIYINEYNQTKKQKFSQIYNKTYKLYACLKLLV